MSDKICNNKWVLVPEHIAEEYGKSQIIMCKYCKKSTCFLYCIHSNAEQIKIQNEDHDYNCFMCNKDITLGYMCMECSLKQRSKYNKKSKKK